MDKSEITADVAKLALPILVERLGGAVTITEADYDAFAARYGGLRNVGVQADYEGTTLKLTIIRAPERPPLD